MCLVLCVKHAVVGKVCYIFEVPTGKESLATLIMNSLSVSSQSGDNELDKTGRLT